jgi:hypothetical protein
MGYAISLLPETMLIDNTRYFLGRAGKFAVQRIDPGLRLSQLCFGEAKSMSGIRVDFTAIQESSIFNSCLSLFHYARKN